MSATTMIPVTVSPEARAFVDRIGQVHELETMIDWARHIVNGLRSSDVVLDEVTEEMPPGVVLWVHRGDIGTGSDPMHREWIDWMIATFPPSVCQNFTLLSVFDADGR